MSLSKWKELAQKKTAVGKMKKNIFDEITAENIRSKTTDQAIAKTFRLDFFFNLQTVISIYNTKTATYTTYTT